MKRENASFLLGGIFFGFLVGFSVSYFVYRQEPAPGFLSDGMQAPTNPSDPTGEGAKYRLEAEYAVATASFRLEVQRGSRPGEPKAGPSSSSQR